MAQIEAGDWLGVVAFGEERLVPVEFRAAPGQRLDLDTRGGIELRRVRARVVTPAGAGVADVAPAWRFRRDGSRTADGAGTASAPDAGRREELLESVLGVLSGRSDAEGSLSLVLPARAAGVLAVEAKGFRNDTIRQEERTAATVPVPLVLAPLPKISLSVPRLHPAEESLFTVRLDLVGSARPGPGRTEGPAAGAVRAGETIVLGTLADADHRIEVRDDAGRLAGALVVSTRDRDWGGATVSRVVERVPRLIRGRVLWNDEPLSDAAVVGLLHSGDRGAGDERYIPTQSLERPESLADAARTDSSGEFVLTVNVPGRYTVLAFPPGFTTGKSASDSVDTEALEQKPVEVRFTGRYLKMRVVDDETGEPIQGAQVEARSKSPDDGEKDGARYSTVKTTDREGGATALGLLGGPLVVTVSAKGYAGRRLTPKPSSDLPPVTTEIRLKPGKARTVRCVDEQGVPIAGVELLGLTEESRGTPFAPVHPLGITDSRGECTFDDPGAASPHLVLLAAGRAIRVIPRFADAGGGGAPELFVLPAIGFGPTVRVVTEEKGQVKPVARLQVVAAFDGLLLPWNHVVFRKARLDGTTAYLRTGADGSVGLARALGAGAWELVALPERPKSLERPGLLRLGALSFPLVKDEVVTIRRK
ncbi:MAG: MSCRAMM family protein [Thermoanaerobaculia bacterium]